MPNPSLFCPMTQREKKVSITVCSSILEGVVPIVKPENKSVMRMCPGLSSSLPMVSTCTTSLKWVTSVSMMSERCECNLHLWMIWVRLPSLFGGLERRFNLTNEPWPVFSNPYKPKVTLQKIIERNLFPLLFKIFSVVTYTVSSSVRLTSIKHLGYCSLISEPIIGGRSLSSMAKKKGINFDLILRMMASLLFVNIPSFSWNDFLSSMWGEVLCVFYFDIVPTFLDPIMSVIKELS